MRSFVWREFLSSKGEEYEESEDGSELKLGDAPMAPPLNFNEPPSEKILGCPTHPLFFIDYHEVIFVELRFYHFTYYVLCLERLFAFSFFVSLLVIFMLDPRMLGASFFFQFCFVSLLVMTRSAFSFEYSFTSLISCWVFLATVCLLVSSYF